MRITRSPARTLRPHFLAALAGAALFAAVIAIGGQAGPAPAIAADDEPVADMWPGIRKEVFAQKEIAEEDGAVMLDAPYRAEDAAIVPLTVHIPDRFAADVKALTLIVDKNPSPVVARFDFGPAAGTGARMIATRVRIDMYSHVRAVVETNDGRLHMTTRFVKASGGCSAPAGKDAEAALASLGRMQIKTFDAAATPAAERSSHMREAQVMIKHPNYTGMQMDQLSRAYTPAMFVDKVEIKRGGALVFRMEGGISISEDPNIRFTYAAGPDDTLEASVQDTDGRTFSARTAPKGS